MANMQKNQKLMRYYLLTLSLYTPTFKGPLDLECVHGCCFQIYTLQHYHWKEKRKILTYFYKSPKKWRNLAEYNLKINSYSKGEQERNKKDRTDVQLRHNTQKCTNMSQKKNMVPTKWVQITTQGLNCMKHMWQVDGWVAF
jgi:hypothetical protein